MNRRRRRGLLAAMGIVLPATAVAQAPMGAEFRLNVYTTGAQARPAVASDGNGDFYAVWEGPQTGGDVIGAWFDTTGALRRPEFRVNLLTTGAQSDPAISASADSSFVVVWTTDGQDGSGDGVAARRFQGVGLPVGPDLQVNTYTTSHQQLPDVAADAAGNFVAVWASAGQDGSGTGIFGRRFDAAGAPLGGEFQVNTYTTQSQLYPAIASSPGGAFVVVWRSVDGDQDGVAGRLFDGAGAPQGAEFPINTHTTESQREPAVAMDAAGNFVVVWHSRDQDGSVEGVFGRRFDASGAPRGGEFQVNTFTNVAQLFPDVATDRDGAFLVTWNSVAQDGSATGVFGQLYDALGAPVGGEFRVNTFTTGAQRLSAVASVARGDFVVAWQSDGQDGSDYGIYGQRYGDLIFRDGVETGYHGSWSSASTDGADLDSLPEAALAGTTFGLRALVNDTNPLYVRDDSPAAEDHYRARFYFDTNGFDPGEATDNRRVRLFIAHDALNQRLATIVLRRLGGEYAVMGRVRRDDGTRADTGFHAITDGPHMVELRWQRATGPSADGFFILRIDDVQASALTGIDNGDGPIEYARLGVMAIKSAAAGGTMYFDQFESRRQRQIGPE